MIIFKLLEILSSILLVYFLWTQIIYPALKGRNMFPYFRRERRLKDDIAHAKQTNFENEIEEQLEKEIYKND